MDSIDRHIINSLQGGFPVCEHPFAQVASSLNLDESELINRIQRLQQDGFITRFGPMYQAERLGGGLTLAAMAVKEQDFDRITEIINAFPEVAHNYRREHDLNMWFVLATDTPDRIGEVINEIESQTGYTVYNMPKQEEFFIGLKFEV